MRKKQSGGLFHPTRETTMARAVQGEVVMSGKTEECYCLPPL